MVDAIALSRTPKHHMENMGGKPDQVCYVSVVPRSIDDQDWLQGDGMHGVSAMWSDETCSENVLASKQPT